MTIPAPRLDDRSFDDLVAEALAVVDRLCPAWTERSRSDPGITLIEAFAYLTKGMLYRLNRVPEKVQVSLLNMIGLRRRPPSAAVVTLRFALPGPSEADLTIPEGTRIGVGRGQPEFVTVLGATLARGAASVDVPALHCERMEAELLGTGTGAPGQSFRLRRPPVIASNPERYGPDLVIGVETPPDGLLEGAASLPVGERVFALWREVDSFAGTAAGDLAYMVDRAEGLVTFAPARDASGRGAVPLAASPEAGREVRAWYRRGGGQAGNVEAGWLDTVLAGQLLPPSLTVTNPARAAGGADAETLADAVRRGPEAIGQTEVAMTARDFERLATGAGGVAHAKAHALAQTWRHAEPGLVEVLLVPSPGVSPDGAVPLVLLAEHQSEPVRQRVADLLDRHRPLGVRSTVAWARARPVSVVARVVVIRERDVAATAERLRGRLDALLSPLRGRPFGRTPRSSDVYEAILAEPGVRYADRIAFRIDTSPAADVTDLARDPHQPRTWHAVAADGVYRTLDDAESWERVLPGADQPVFARRHRDRPGLLAVGVKRGASGAVHVSHDCGETWTLDAAVFEFDVEDAAWITRNGAPLLLIATARGLFQFVPGGDAGPSAVAIDGVEAGRGAFAVTSTTTASGLTTVAVALYSKGGVVLSASAGLSGSFRPIGLKGKDVRVLGVQRFNAREQLWAGLAAEARQEGEGTYRLELRATGEDDPEGWKATNLGWQGGSCESLAFSGSTVFAGSYRAGVLVLTSSDEAPRWTPSRINAGLPLRDTEQLLQRVTALAVAPPADGVQPVLLAGGPEGVFRSLDGGRTFANASARTFQDRVALPPTWIACPGPHDVTVLHDEEA